MSGKEPSGHDVRGQEAKFVKASMRAGYASLRIKP